MVPASLRPSKKSRTASNPASSAAARYSGTEALAPTVISVGNLAVAAALVRGGAAKSRRIGRARLMVEGSGR